MTIFLNNRQGKITYNLLITGSSFLVSYSPYITENGTVHCRDYASFRQQVETERKEGEN